MSEYRSLRRFFVLGLAFIVISALSVAANNFLGGYVVYSIKAILGVTSAPSNAVSLSERRGVGDQRVGDSRSEDVFTGKDDTNLSSLAANGKIVFSSNRDQSNISIFKIWTMNPDSTGVTCLMCAGGDSRTGRVPAFSPDGNTIAYQDTGVIQLMSADGTYLRALTTGGSPAWSPDGTRLVFTKFLPNASPPHNEIFIINSDGTGETQITTGSANSLATPSWGAAQPAFPQGRIAFTNFSAANKDIYMIAPTSMAATFQGSPQINVTNHPAFDHAAHWSPDGLKLAFYSDRDQVNSDIYVLQMNPSPGTVTRLTTGPASHSFPKWSPDGTKILYGGSGGFNIDIFVINSATGALIEPPPGGNITNNPAQDFDHDWGAAVIAPGCTFSISPEDQTFGENANTGSVVVTQTSNGAPCPWRVEVSPWSGEGFLTILSSPSGTGNGTFEFGVAANTAAFGRGGEIVLIGSGTDRVRILVWQTVGGGSCTYYVSPARMYFDIPGGQGSFQIIAPPGCPWTAIEDDSWIHISGPGSGTGTADIMYTVDANDGQYAFWRVGGFAVNGQHHSVNQSDGKACPAETMSGMPESYSGYSSPSQKAPVEIDQLRGFRDNVLAKTSRGQKYTQDYYGYAGEITKLLIFNPSLFYRSKDALERYRPVVESVLKRERAKADLGRSGEMVADQIVLEPTIVNDTELADIDGLLASLSAKASGQLRQTLDGLRRDIYDPQVQAEFGVRIALGPKRSLPNERHSMAGIINELLPFDLRSGFQFLNPLSEPTTVAEIPREEPPVPSALAPVSDVYGQIPLSFETNKGQIDGRVKYLSRGAGYNLFLTPSEAVLALPEKAKAGRRKDGNEVMDLVANLSNQKVQTNSAPVHTLRMKLDGADPAPLITALDKTATKSNYFIGNDSRKWRIGIPNYSRVEYKEVYEGVDLVYYGNQRQLEYDFKVAPGADPNMIRMSFAGADKVELDDGGDLLLYVDGREVRMLAPVTYQEKGGVRRQIASHYVLHGNADSQHRSIGFEVAAYDTSELLVIDPVLVYSTYLGGGGDDVANSITVDAAGNAYVIGFTDSINFPLTAAIQPIYGGNPQDVFVSKLNAAGTALVYSTYLGGSGQDNGSDIAVDTAGNAYITGYTGSTNFPMASAMQPTRTGFYNAFVAKLNPTGSQLVYSTYYGGTTGEFGSAIAVDSTGNAYVGGVTSSPDFPKTNPIQANYGGSLADAFVAKFNPAGSQIVYSTYLGGNGNDGVTGIAVDGNGSVNLTGVTFSSNFPVANAIQPNFGGGAFDAFATTINPAGTALTFSTYLGGTGDDRGYRVKLDARGNAYVAGSTESANFPTAGPFQPALNGIVDAFLTKLTSDGMLSYSTFLGGSGLDGATGLAVTNVGNAYLTGFTNSTDFPLLDPSQPVNNGGEFDVFVTKLNATGTALAYSTYLGGSGFDSAFDIELDQSRNAYVFGRTASTNFPTVIPLQPANGGGPFDVFITKLTSTTSGDGLESDVAPRTTGDGVVLATDVTQMRRFATGLDTPNPAFNETQRADCAPRSTRGDGTINSGDVIQTRRYAAGLDPLTAASGPAAESTMPDVVLGIVDSMRAGASARKLSVASATAAAGTTVSIPVELTPHGDEMAISFTLDYDHTKLSNARVTLTDATTNGAVLTVNSAANGRLAVLVDYADELTASSRPRQIVWITFDVANYAVGSVPLTFSGSVAALAISNAKGEVVPFRLVSGEIKIVRMGD